MFRKSGWFIFVAFFSVISLTVYLFAGLAIKSALVKGLEQATGAEVNIATVSLQWAPLGLTLRELQLTDPARPTHNSVSFRQARASLELWPALLGYVVIDELSVDGVAYGAVRSHQGRVYEQTVEPNEKRADLSTLTREALPSQEDLLARADLKTLAKGQELATLAASEQQKLANLNSQMPSQEKLKAYEAEIKTLTGGKIKDAAELAVKTEQLKNLKTKINTEKERLSDIKSQIASSAQRQVQALAELKQASADDWKKVQGLAQLGNGGLVQILLGDLWADRLRQAENLYRLVAPYIPASKGSDAVESQPETADLPTRLLPLSHPPYPDFWVKKTRATWLVGGGEAVLAVDNITAQHALINAATTFLLDAENLPNVAALKISGDFAIYDQLKANVAWTSSRFALDNLVLGQGESVLTLTSAALATQGSLALLDDTLIQKSVWQLTNASFTSVGNQTLQQLVALLNKQNELPINIKASGQLNAPKVSVSSPLDKILSDALMGEAKEKVAQYRAQLKGKLDQQMQQALAGEGDWSDQLDIQSGNINDIEKQIETLLSAKIGGVENQLKDSLLKKIGSK